jgi:hypothetical protein
MSVIDPLSRIGSPQQGHRSGKTCILSAPNGATALALASLPVAGLDTDPGVQGEACP